MNAKQTLAMVACCLGITLLGIATFGVPALHAGTLPDQPLVSFWFPNDLLSWDPSTDPDAPFNRGSVPLRDRFFDADAQANTHARANEATVAILSTGFNTTSNNPSQGGLGFDSYTFGYWPYIDIWVFWGGSAGEGLILAPNAGLIDAAHKNGVKMYGNIFFPPNVFGGNIQWVRDLVQRDGGGTTFPVADKLIEVATFYGFDGWFINQETSGGDAALATDIREFMRYVRATSSIEIQWYDAMIESGPIFYQNALTTQNDAFFQENAAPVSDGMFLNYFWNSTRITNSANLATALGRSPYDLFAGIDVGQNGSNSSVNWDALFPEGAPHRMSLGIFATQWTLNSASSPEDYYARALAFWSGPFGNPGNTPIGAAWGGIAHYIPAKSSINDLPFVTHFNSGQGELFSVEGEVLSDEAWHNRGLQDLLPTWRWLMFTTTSGSPTLESSLDFTQAYEGGASLRVQGDFDRGHRLELFRTQIDITTDTRLEIVYRTGSAATPSNLGVALTVGAAGGGLAPPDVFPVGDTVSAGWNRVVLDVSALDGEPLKVIGLEFDTDAPLLGYDVQIGRIALYETPVDVPAPPTAFTVDTKTEIDSRTATLRLSWDHSPDDRYAYNVYRLNRDGGRTYLGGTLNNAYFVPKVVRGPSEDTVTIEVETVGSELGRSTAATTTFTWDVPALIFSDGFESGDVSNWSSATP